uniref:Protein TRANSPARENT TESTA 12 n=1 Tax=Aegilops tauschii subsp. strangulata TaxID=200361 RepID=A0A453HPS9_AEGTS
MFTESRAVANAVADLSPLLAFSILLNSVQPVLPGVAVGAGWQSVVAYVNITSYYMIGIPLGVVLGYIVRFQVKVITQIISPSHHYHGGSSSPRFVFATIYMFKKLGHLDWDAGRNTGSNCCTCVHNTWD